MAGTVSLIYGQINALCYYINVRNNCYAVPRGLLLKGIFLYVWKSKRNLRYFSNPNTTLFVWPKMANLFSRVNCTFHFSYSRPFLRRNLKKEIDSGKHFLSNKKFQRKNDFWALCSQSIFAMFSRVNFFFHFSHSRPFLRRNLKKEIDSGKHLSVTKRKKPNRRCEHHAHNGFFGFWQTVFLFWRFSKIENWKFEKTKTLFFSVFFWKISCEHNAHKVIFECIFLLLTNVFQSQFLF